jgi:predicted phage terminase large subunit-like protein
MTRWNYDDLAGRLINDPNSDEKWEVLDLPAIARDNDILGRREGDALWPNRYSKSKLENIKKQVGSYWFSSLYQQKPMATEHQIFKAEWWQEYSVLPEGQFLIQSWDTAFKEKEQNDFSVCTTWLLAKNGFYLVGFWRGKVQFPDLQRQVIMQYNKYKPGVVLIEDAASGQSLIQVLQRETKLPIKPVKAIKDKVTRAHLVTPLLEAGKVFIPKDATFMADIINECSEFPYGNHDDIVDSITQALDYLRKRSTGTKSSNFLTSKTNKENHYSGY